MQTLLLSSCDSNNRCCGGKNRTFKTRGYEPEGLPNLAACVDPLRFELRLHEYQSCFLTRLEDGSIFT